MRRRRWCCYEFFIRTVRPMKDDSFYLPSSSFIRHPSSNFRKVLFFSRLRASLVYFFFALSGCRSVGLLPNQIACDRC
ncbi:hypothetical protein BDW71DRAFT_176456 [Aspergillus fruticulosus]